MLKEIETNTENPFSKEIVYIENEINKLQEMINQKAMEIENPVKIIIE